MINANYQSDCLLMWLCRFDSAVWHYKAYNMAVSITVHLQIFRLPYLLYFLVNFYQTYIRISDSFFWMFLLLSKELIIIFLFKSSFQSTIIQFNIAVPFHFYICQILAYMLLGTNLIKTKAAIYFWYPLPLRFGNFVVNLDGILLIELLLRSQTSTITSFIKKYVASGTCVKSQLDRSVNTYIS